MSNFNNLGQDGYIRKPRTNPTRNFNTKNRNQNQTRHNNNDGNVNGGYNRNNDGNVNVGYNNNRGHNRNNRGNFNRHHQNQGDEKASDIINNMKNKFDDNSRPNEHIDYKTKQMVIQYIYNTIRLSNYKYKLIEFDDDLPLLKELNYYVSPNYTGIHSLLVFTKINDQYFSFIIDRKTLTYNINQVDYNRVKLIPVSIRLDEEIYKGTILDGVLLYNTIDGMKHFVVNDLYYIRGKEVTHDKITNKILNFSTYLDTVKPGEKIDNHIDNLILIPNKLYHLKDIKQLVNMYIPKSKYNKAIKGITFYPEYSGMKLIYLYSNATMEDKANDEQKEEETNVTINTKTKIITDFVDPKEVKEVQKEIRKANIEVTEGSVTAVFRMKKTDIIDVYNLYLGTTIKKGDKKLFKYQKIDIAYIPTKECSYFCKDAFSKIDTDSLLVRCKYEKEKSRWIPVELVTNQKISDSVDKIKDFIN